MHSFFFSKQRISCPAGPLTDKKNGEICVGSSRDGQQQKEVEEDSGQYYYQAEGSARCVAWRPHNYRLLRLRGSKVKCDDDSPTDGQLDSVRGARMSVISIQDREREEEEGKSQVFKVETGQSSLGFRPVNLFSREFRNNLIS